MWLQSPGLWNRCPRQTGYWSEISKIICCWEKDNQADFLQGYSTVIIVEQSAVPVTCSFHIISFKWLFSWMPERGMEWECSHPAEFFFESIKNLFHRNGRSASEFYPVLHMLLLLISLADWIIYAKGKWHLSWCFNKNSDPSIATHAIYLSFWFPKKKIHWLNGRLEWAERVSVQSLVGLGLLVFFVLFEDGITCPLV